MALSVKFWDSLFHSTRYVSSNTWLSASSFANVETGEPLTSLPSGKKSWSILISILCERQQIITKIFPFTWDQYRISE